METPKHSKMEIDQSTGCWNWIAARDSNGYGMATINNKQVRIHRISAFLFHGMPVSRKMVVMHLCDNPSCFNPAHLSVGTQGDNMRDCSTKKRTANSKKTHCLLGHELAGDNLYVFTGANGRVMRTCKECRKTRIRLYMRKRRSLKHSPI